MTRGQIGYEAYAASTGGKTFDGRDMPAWAALPSNIKQAWMAAAKAIADDVLDGERRATWDGVR